MEKKTKALIILSAFVLIFMIIGGTLAYWNWQSSSEQNTAVTFTVASGFSCSADGGGSITSNDKVLAPAACTNTTYAIKRTITVSPTITQPNKTIYLDMWLKVNSIGSGLAASQNFKYALTTSSSNCTTDVVTQGNFWLAETNTKRMLLQDKRYTSTTTETYYLWVWLDSAETNSNTMNQSFNIELGGNCTDSAPVYTANIYDSQVQGWNSVWIGQPIPSSITEKFYDPNGAAQAMNSLKVAGGNTTDYPFFLKHKIGNGTLWCATYDSDSYCVYQTQAECNSKVVDDWGSEYTCVQNNVTNGVSESYVGFVVTSTMATNNPGMTVGTYYLKGGDNGRAYNENKAILLTAFGSSYCTDYSSLFSCSVSGLAASADSNGNVNAYGTAGSNCSVNDGGGSSCDIPSWGGGVM